MNDANDVNPARVHRLVGRHLIDKWLECVNQPVVDNVCETVKELLLEVSDGGLFDHRQCLEILAHIVATCPPHNAPDQGARQETTTGE